MSSPKLPPGTSGVGGERGGERSERSEATTPSHSRFSFDAETLLYTVSERSVFSREIEEEIEVRERGGPDPLEGCVSPAKTASVALRANIRGLDGGYGWVITFGSFISAMVEGAFERGEGIMYPYFLERFHESHQMTTLPGAMASTLRFLLSPLASIVCNRYSIRTSVMFGALVFTSGVFLTQFAHSLYMLMFTYGFLTGCGRAFFSGPSLIVIGLYFRERQGLASGIAVSGVGLGTFLLVPIFSWCFETYLFQGAFLALSSAAAQMLVVAMLYRPLSTNNRYLALAAKRKLEKCLANRQTEERDIQAVIDPETVANFREEMAKANALSTRSSEVDMALPFRLTKSGRLETGNVRSLSTIAPTASRCQKVKAVFCDNCCCVICFPVEDFNVNQDQETTGPREQSHVSHLIRDKAFIFYCLTTFFLTGSLKVVYLFLPVLVESKGRSLQDAARLLSLAGAVDVLSRICSGFAMDMSKVRPYRMRVFNCFLVGMCIFSGLLPLMADFIGIIAAMVAYSMCASLCLTGRTVVLVDLIGLRKLSSAFGILMFFQGFGTLLCPPLAGHLLDVYGVIDYGYYLASANMAVAAVCMNISINWHNLLAR